MEDRDFVTRFVSFYITPYSNYEPDLDTFMTKGMGLIKSLSVEQRTQMKNDFDKAMQSAFQIFGDDAFRKRRSVNDRRSPINKALFEVLSVSFSKLNDTETQILLAKKDIFKTKFIELNNDDSFFGSIGGGTGEKTRVAKRFSDIKRIINETISN